MFLILDAVFAIHVIGFIVLGAWRGQGRYFVVAGTFLALSLLYGLKATGLAAYASIWCIVLLRVGAIGCTLCYLALTGGREGTWVNRLLARVRSTGD